ncbi:MAG: hypothetical protein RJA99_737 [Pseudomonadota bacterium]
MGRTSERGLAAKAGRGAAPARSAAGREPVRVTRGRAATAASAKSDSTSAAKSAAKQGAARSARPAASGRTGRTAERAPRGGDAARLGRDDWLDAAYDAVVAGGFDAVRVLPLADALGVSRGSFYWHFEDHAALVAALLDRWFERELAADREVEATRSDDPVADLLGVLDDALARGGGAAADLKPMRFELAIRTLGGLDPAIGRRLAEVDAIRVGVIAEKFARVVADRDTARDLAVLLYIAVAGAHQALSRTGGAGMAGYLRGVIAEHLIRRVAAAPADGRDGGLS